MFYVGYKTDQKKQDLYLGKKSNKEIDNLSFIIFDSISIIQKLKLIDFTEEVL